MNKRFIFIFTLLTGLFTYCLPAFASDALWQQFHEGKQERASTFQTLFISMLVLVILIVVGKFLFLFFMYKHIYGAKDALLRIMFQPRSLMSVGMRGLQVSRFLAQYKKALALKKGQGLAFGFDTNMLMNFPSETFELLKTETVIISREVQKELDGLKNSPDKETSAKARRAFKALEEAQIRGQQITILPSLDFNTIKSLGLSDSKDDKILAAYLKYSMEKGKVCVASNDRGVKITARNAGLAVLEMEESTPAKKSSSGKPLGIIAILIVVAIGFVGYNVYSYFQKNWNYSIFDTISNNETSKQSQSAATADKITIDSSHIYHSTHQSLFIVSTKQVKQLIDSLEKIPSRKEREPLTLQLRNVIQPLSEQFYPNINVDKLTEEEIQGIGYYGQSDIRFGLLIMDWSANKDDEKLKELLAIDSSDVGLKLLESYDNLDQVKFRLIEVLTMGPFES
ncbi:PIN domain-containing protein [Paenibacillus amylolyticus]|uniref:PIN domain-containing protein n=1 Tax=Paenibacillus amylolyticus TaxID=1451 RepID=UPI003EBDB6AC